MPFGLIIEPVDSLLNFKRAQTRFEQWKAVARLRPDLTIHSFRAGEQCPGVLSAVKWSQQQTRVASRSPVRIMSAGRTAWIGNEKSALRLCR